MSNAPIGVPSHEGGLGGRLRVDLFSDAVFAVAITVLVLNLPLTGVSESLLRALADRWPAFAAFGISFVIIGCLWVSHFRLFRHVQRVDGPLLFLNLALLLSVVLVPFGTSTLATFVTRAGSQSHLAAALFACILVFMGLIFFALHLRVRGITPSLLRLLNKPEGVAVLRLLAGVFMNGIGVGIAFVSPLAVMAMTGVTSVFFIVEQITDRSESSRHGRVTALGEGSGGAAGGTG
jgi:uncharacterized membrane protein